MCALYLRDTVPQICGIRRRSAYQLLAIMRPSNGILPRILTQTKVSNNLNVSSDSVIYTDRRSYNFSEYMQDVLHHNFGGFHCRFWLFYSAIFTSAFGANLAGFYFCYLRRYSAFHGCFVDAVTPLNSRDFGLYRLARSVKMNATVGRETVLFTWSKLINAIKGEIMFQSLVNVRLWQFLFPGTFLMFMTL